MWNVIKFDEKIEWKFSTGHLAFNYENRGATNRSRNHNGIMNVLRARISDII